jgi:hypothetical protein
MQHHRIPFGIEDDRHSAYLAPLIVLVGPDVSHDLDSSLLQAPDVGLDVIGFESQVGRRGRNSFRRVRVQGDRLPVGSREFDPTVAVVGVELEPQDVSEKALARSMSRVGWPMKAIF